MTAKYLQHGLTNIEDSILGGFEDVNSILYLNQIYYWRAVREPDPSRQKAIASLKAKRLVEEDPTAPDDAIKLTPKGRLLYNTRAREEEEAESHVRG